MGMHVNADYAPPKSWEQFEELCADTYAADWSDPALQRYGRAGEVNHDGIRFSQTVARAEHPASRVMSGG